MNELVRSLLIVFYFSGALFFLASIVGARKLKKPIFIQVILYFLFAVAFVYNLL